jgi:hypothetical protein
MFSSSSPLGELTEGTDETRRIGGALAYFIKMGSLSLAYIVHHILVLLFGLALFVYTLGLTSYAPLFDHPAFKSWEWWRLVGPLAFNLFSAAAMIYFAYQERVSTQSMGVSFLGRLRARLVIAFYVPWIALVAIFTAVCAVWMSINDVAGTTPPRAIIMMQVGAYAMMAIGAIAIFPFSIYIHASSRDVHAANNSAAAQNGVADTIIRGELPVYSPIKESIASPQYNAQLFGSF